MWFNLILAKTVNLLRMGTMCFIHFIFPEIKMELGDEDVAQG
jgi:hypothetical protein